MDRFSRQTEVVLEHWMICKEGILGKERGVGKHAGCSVRIGPLIIGVTNLVFAV